MESFKMLNFHFCSTTRWVWTVSFAQMDIGDQQVLILLIRMDVDPVTAIHWDLLESVSKKIPMDVKDM